MTKNLNFGNNNIIFSNDYKAEGSKSYVDKAQFLVDNGYPVPTSDIQELAKFLEQRDKEKSKREEDRYYDDWKSRQS